MTIRPDIIVFAISQYNLSAGMLRKMQAALSNGIDVPVRLVRMENDAQTLPGVLDDIVAEGHRAILVQPLGLPFPEGMRSWLDGAIGNWLARRDPGAIAIWLGTELTDRPDLLEGAARTALSLSDTAQPVGTDNTALGKRGWDEPPDFVHHLFVCTGPRCQYRDAPSLVAALKHAVARAGLARKCLTTRTGCMFPCNKGPMVAVYPRGEWYRLETGQEVERFVRTVLGENRTLPDLLIHTARAARTPLLSPEPV